MDLEGCIGMRFLVWLLVINTWFKEAHKVA